jgi:hypothetical protein
VYLSI